MRPGDIVHRGDVVAEIEIDKGVIDVEFFTNGTIDKLLIGGLISPAVHDTDRKNLIAVHKELHVEIPEKD